ncbi:hypothetical protein JJB07_09025 [Tumebacillus sp. ITR2]|uniref:Uncharacterized protein n=1 Tax=Tumebacillus amylolyticus TaxID=2801339 RepID=A0ABS1J9S4_9BACL|nr:hypothetical protein [Tumebacillus amylolyticus]MBL0386794.1 hypothetical protein [Tumebacillus amylolyticus]
MNLYGTAIYIRTLELSAAEAMLRLEVSNRGLFLRGPLQSCYVGIFNFGS